MPSKAYCKYLDNIETVNRLKQTYDDIRKARGCRGRAAFDHVTRSAIIFLAASFEVYIEDIILECCNIHIRFSRDAKNLPNTIKNSINEYVKVEANSAPPISLCDEGWREIYRKLVIDKTSKLNTPKKGTITNLLKKLADISNVDSVPNIDDLNDIVEFRGDIAHRVKAEVYVTIDQVEDYQEKIDNIVEGIDRLILDYFHQEYPRERAPWNATY